MKTNMKEYLCVIILLTVCWLRGFSTTQIRDRFLYQGDTLYTYLYLPPYFYDSDTLIVDLFDRQPCIHSACWNGYFNDWRIDDDQLYLTGIYSCSYYEDSIQADLKKLFKDKYDGEKVKADWVTGKILTNRGEPMLWATDFPIYERETEFEVENGMITGMREYDNSKSRKSIYSQDQQKLFHFIYSRIRWDSLPELPEPPVRVSLLFMGNAEGKIDSVKIMRGSEEIFNREAVRVLKELPEWDTFFIRGKVVEIPWTVPIVFSKENKDKYYNGTNKE